MPGFWPSVAEWVPRSNKQLASDVTFGGVSLRPGSTVLPSD